MTYEVQNDTTSTAATERYPSPTLPAVDSHGLAARQRGHVQEGPDGERVQLNLGVSPEHSAALPPGLRKRVSTPRRG